MKNAIERGHDAAHKKRHQKDEDGAPCPELWNMSVTSQALYVGALPRVFFATPHLVGEEVIDSSLYDILTRMLHYFAQSTTPFCLRFVTSM